MPAESLSAPERKLAELILYVSAKCADDANFGAVKLNKILFQADSAAYVLLGKPITEADYAKHEHGPCPRNLIQIRDALEQAREIAVQRELRYLPSGWVDNMPMTRVVPLRDPDLTLFSSEEIALVGAVIDSNRGLSGRDLSEWTHGLPGWLTAEMFETISLDTIFVSNRREATDFEREHARELIQRYGWET